MTRTQRSPLETIGLKLSDGVALVTLNRPDALNALNSRVIDELTGVFEQLRIDDKVRGVIVTGSGDRAFAAGADITELSSVSPAEAHRHSEDGQQLMDVIETLGKPVVAAVNGFAFGGGCELALACSLRIGSPRAAFGFPEVRLGLIPGFGGTQRLPRLIGRGRALSMILTGGTVGANEALEFGLLNEIAAVDELIPRAQALLDEIGKNAPLAIGYALQAVNHGLDGSLQSGLALERSLFADCAATQDMREGTAAFIEKRPATFHGR